MIHARIIGTGSCAPKKVLTNHDLERMVETSDAWITERTGIKERRGIERALREGLVRAVVTTNALELGIETLYQDLALAENLNVYSNIFLGRELVRAPFSLDEDAMEAASRTVLDRLKIFVPSLSESVINLSGGQRQAIAIGRAIYFNAKILIMDEPTASLAVREVGKVLELIKGLREHGVSVILISHRLQDVFAVTDRVMVLRHGIKVGDRSTAETTMDEVGGLMVGARGDSLEEARTLATAG